MTSCSAKKPVTSLEDICIRWICKNLAYLTYTVQTDNKDARLQWKIPCPNFRITARPAQKLLLQMFRRKILTDETMYLFSKNFVDLISPVLRDARIGPLALRVLKDFNLVHLSAINMENLNLNSIIGCLNEHSLRNMKSLNISGTSIMSETGVPIVVGMGWFTNLNILNVTRTELSTQSLKIMVNDLPQLRYLDISMTKVDDISVLLDIKNRLQGLIMHRLEMENPEHVLAVVLHLHKLRCLDVSITNRTAMVRVPRVSQLTSLLTFPEIVKIDMSGNPFCLTASGLRQFIKNHPLLNFCGIASWNSSSEKELAEIHKIAQKNPQILFLGDYGEDLLHNTLLHCKDRPAYLQYAFQKIFEATNPWNYESEQYKTTLLAATLTSMRNHTKRPELMVAATAVIYNLIKADSKFKMPKELLNRAVRMTLKAMELFPQNPQINKNCFLTMCTDNVLHEADFSHKVCCELVFNALLQFDDVHLNRMGVAIISVLAADVPTSDLRELARNTNRIQCLLGLIAENCLLASDITPQSDDLHAPPPPIDVQRWPYLSRVRLRTQGGPIFDPVLRFTLSALWNLTDECVEACLGFVEHGGLAVFEMVLDRFNDQEEDIKNHVYIKCLGLLNNVAEVDETGFNLMKENLMNFFLKMLVHQNIQMSYFAAGILAHLCCLPDTLWVEKLEGIATKESCIRSLGQAVCSWSKPESDMVSYRTLKPFETLIFHSETRLEIQLWAVWAIHHILTRNNSRYVPLLRACTKLHCHLKCLSEMDEVELCYRNLSGSRRKHHHQLYISHGDAPESSDDYQTEEIADDDEEEVASSGRPSTSSRVESVISASTGISANPGPSSEKLACALLIKSLAAEIITCDMTKEDQQQHATSSSSNNVASNSNAPMMDE